MFHQLTQLLVLLLCLLAASCRENPSPTTTPATRLAGETMGTTYSVILAGDYDAGRAKALVDSILLAINAEVNTYDSTALISLFNRGGALELPLLDDPYALHAGAGEHLVANLMLARDPVRLSAGAFDPTVGPLVQYFGFGAERRDTSAVDSAEVTRLRALVGFDSLALDTVSLGDVGTAEQTAWSPILSLRPRIRGQYLDLSAIAKGYAVDQVALLLGERLGSRDHFVEIGGEVRAVGQSPRGTPWTIGINTPREGAALDDLELVVQVSDRAVATSGNYRNFRERGGRRVWHTIDPRTGYPKATTLLSASVVASDCATADAFATTAMASGEDAPRVLAEAGLDACLIFAGAEGTFDVRYVGGFEGYVLEGPAE